ERKLERDADMGGDGAHLPGVGRWGKAVELHGPLLFTWVDEETSQANSAASLSSPSVQPAWWRSRAGSSKNCSWVRVNSVPSPSGLSSTVTSDSRSGVLCHAQVNTSFSFGFTSR